MTKLTVKELCDRKGVKQTSFVQVTSVEQLLAAAKAGIDMIGTGFRDETRRFPSLVPETHFQLGLAYGKHASPKEALRDAFLAMECGAESIYCAMSPGYVEVMATEGVPVIAHVGLIPPKATWVGGLNAVGKTSQQALQVWRAVKAFEDAGAFAVEMEVIPDRIATEITKRTSLLTISLGSGGGCDIQYLFSDDLLGENRGHIPRHAKTYRNLAVEFDRIQAERIAAYREFIDDINNKAFPGEENIVDIPDHEFDQFMNVIQ